MVNFGLYYRESQSQPTVARFVGNLTKWGNIDMRVFILLLGLIAFPLAAGAQDTTIVTPHVADGGPVDITPAVPSIPHSHSLSEAVPKPRLQAEVDTYRVAAIAVGAVAGVVVANAVTGGMITPILMYGSSSGTAVLANGYTAAATHTLVTAGGAIGGGYIANWIYGE